MSDEKETTIDAETTDLVQTDPDAEAIIVHSFDKVVQSVINEAQFQILTGRTKKSVIKQRPGRGGKTFSYVPHGYVTAVLNQAFGFDWDFVTMPFGNGDHFKVMEADEPMKRKASVLINGRLIVRIHAPNSPETVIAEITKSATGEREMIKGMTWGSLVKSAESDALKKAASKLGVALDLYWEDADEEYIPPSAETLAVRHARARVLEVYSTHPGMSPRAIADLVSDELDIDIPTNKVVRWIRTEGE